MREADQRYKDPAKPSAFEIETVRNNCMPKCSYCALSRGYGGKQPSFMKDDILYDVINTARTTDSDI